jgi:hypothetical protein
MPIPGGCHQNIGVKKQFVQIFHIADDVIIKLGAAGVNWGIHGQHIFVQPRSGIVMVQTSVNDQASGRQDGRPYQYRDALWAGVLKSLGGFTE